MSHIHTPVRKSGETELRKLFQIRKLWIKIVTVACKFYKHCFPECETMHTDDEQMLLNENVTMA